MALGSTREQIFRLVLPGTTGIAVMGILTGGIGSLAAARLLCSMLVGVSPFDPVSYCAAAVLLWFTVSASGIVPAHRVASADPMQSFRCE